MASILEMYEKSIPKAAKADTKGGDKTKIEADGGLNLSKDDKKLSKARGGALNEKKYSDSITKK
jgi:hypothetical protein